MRMWGRNSRPGLIGFDEVGPLLEPKVVALAYDLRHTENWAAF